jgi:hypothetical protein
MCKFLLSLFGDTALSSYRRLTMRMPWSKKQQPFWVYSMQMVEPVIFDLVLRRTPFGYESQWRVDQMSQNSGGAIALAQELARALPEILRRANRTAPAARRSFT